MRVSSTNMVTMVRCHRDGNRLTVVISVNPWANIAGPRSPSAHLQTYHFDHHTKRGHLVTDSPYRTESAAVAKFDAMFPNAAEVINL